MRARLERYYRLVGERVRRRREALGMEQGMLAVLTGVPPEIIERLEVGSPGLQSGYFLDLVAKALEVPTAAIDEVPPDFHEW